MTLAQCIEALYIAFAPYGRRDLIDGCPHCVGRAEQDTLARVPLRTLSCEQLSRYAFKAITTWGAPDDYKHFLPRIMDLAITQEGRGWPGLDLQLIAGKLQLAGWKSWPEAELDALERFAGALWQTVLASDPIESLWRASEALRGIAAITRDLTSYLAVWSADRSLTSALQLAEVIDASWADLANHGQLRGVWRGAPGSDEIARWLTAPARRRALEAAFELHVDDAASSRLAAAVDAWQWMTSGVR